LLINGKIYQGPRDFRSLDNLVRLLVFEERQFDQCPPFVIDLQKQYFARLATAKGEVLLQLYPLKAPLAVNNFVYLARQGWYNSITFHRVIPGYIAQTGDPSGSGFGTPGYAFPDDHNDLRFDQAGVLAMANAGRDSNGSQFFITYKAIPELNGQYAIFGKVLEGIDVLGRLTPRDPSSSADLPEGDILQSVTIEER
jgi:cyclophilin family peptidyl-prolyl cis-trans isomerase